MNRIFWNGFADSIIVLFRESLENCTKEIVQPTFPFLTVEIPDDFYTITVITTFTSQKCLSQDRSVG